MDIQKRRSLVDKHITSDKKFRRCCQKNYLRATIQDRVPFISEEFFASAGSKEIVVVFKAGEKNTPQDRAFDLYLPRHIESGIYPLNDRDQLIEVALTETSPVYNSFWAFRGEMQLSVDAEKREYCGTFDVVFKDKENREFVSEGRFAFALDA